MSPEGQVQMHCIVATLCLHISWTCLSPEATQSLLTMCFVQELAHSTPIVEELALHVAAAVYVKQISLQDLLGLTGLAVFSQNQSKVAIQTDFAQAIARQVLWSYMDADGVSCTSQHFARCFLARHRLTIT